MYQRTLKLSKDERKTLIDYRNHDRRPDVRERCAAILKVADGQSPYAVAREGLLRPRDPDTVYHWLDRYEQQGIEGLLSGRQGGNRRRPFRRAGARVGAASARPRRGSPARGGADIEWAAAQPLDIADHSRHD